jgi:hypothetical protein
MIGVSDVRASSFSFRFFAAPRPSSIAAARIWFQFVERVTGNHVDE